MGIELLYRGQGVLKRWLVLGEAVGKRSVGSSVRNVMSSVEKNVILCGSGVIIRVFVIERRIKRRNC